MTDNLYTITHFYKYLPHASQVAPPQSTAVSSWFLMPSVQVSEAKKYCILCHKYPKYKDISLLIAFCTTSHDTISSNLTFSNNTIWIELDIVTIIITRAFCEACTGIYITHIIRKKFHARTICAFISAIEEGFIMRNRNPVCEATMSLVNIFVKGYRKKENLFMTHI